MFKNMGRKIKGLAKFKCWLEIITCVATGILFIIMGSAAKMINLSYYLRDLFPKGYVPTGKESVVFGVLIMIVGPILAWIGSFVLCGFGELVENSSKLVELKSKED